MSDPLPQATVNFAALAGIPIIPEQITPRTPPEERKAPLVMRSGLHVVSEDSTEGRLLTRAHELVAQHAAAAAVRDVDWGDYPDLGDGDFRTVLSLLNQSLPYPDRRLYEAAYAFLSARAALEI